MNRFFLSAITAILMIAAQIIERPPTMTPTPFPYPEPRMVLTDDVIDHMHEIYALGQRLGNRSGVFSKIGDSITVSYQFLYPFGMGQYALGRYTDLEPIIDYFGRVNARDGNSFVNPSLAAHVGWTAYAAIDPNNADPDECAPDETPLVCEYRLVRPSVALIMFGTNDAGFADLSAFRYNMRRIVQISLGMGVIPVISTIPNRPTAAANVIDFNDAIREIAEELHVPLWDYHAALDSLPDQGLAADNVHPSYPPTDEATTTNFRPPYLDYGYNVRNLTALEMLYAVWWHTQVG